MDGAAKVYRTCCAASSKKITNVGSLNKFIACSNTPSKKSKFCKYLMNGQRSDVPERLDCGYMTRSKTRELGLDKEFLTTSMGCRKRDAIKVRKTRKKTAGMVYCYRPCGVSMGHCEAIHAETCTIFMVLLIDLFGCSPSPDVLTGTHLQIYFWSSTYSTGIAIDRSCDVAPYINRIGEEGSEVCGS